MKNWIVEHKELFWFVILLALPFIMTLDLIFGYHPIIWLLVGFQGIACVVYFLASVVWKETRK